MSRHRTPPTGRGFVPSKSLSSNGLVVWHPGCSCRWVCAVPRSLRLGHPGREAGPQSQGSLRDSLAVEGAEAGRPAGSPSCQSKESPSCPVSVFAAALIAVLAFTACTDSDTPHRPPALRAAAASRAASRAAVTPRPPLLAIPRRPTPATRRRPIRPTRSAPATPSPTAPGPTPTARRSSRWIPTCMTRPKPGRRARPAPAPRCCSRPRGSGLYGVGTCGPHGHVDRPGRQRLRPEQPELSRLRQRAARGTTARGRAPRRPAASPDCGSIPAATRPIRSTPSAPVPERPPRRCP